MEVAQLVSDVSHAGAVKGCNCRSSSCHPAMAAQAPKKEEKKERARHGLPESPWYVCPRRIVLTMLGRGRGAMKRQKMATIVGSK